jgi:hypothetical protein
MLSFLNKNMKTNCLRFVMTTLSVTLLSLSSWAGINKTLSFYGGALQVQVTAPNALAAGNSAKNQFSLLVMDGNGTPYPSITKQWIKASVEMTSMDMGITPAAKMEDVLDANKQLQGKINIFPVFSMTGPWKLNLTVTVSDENGNPMNDTQELTFDVNK